MKSLKVGAVYVCVEDHNSGFNLFKVGHRYRLREHSKKNNRIHYFVEMDMLDIGDAHKKVMEHESIMDIFVLDRICKIKNLLRD